MTDNELIKGRYNRVAKYYDWLEKPMERSMFSKWRKELIRLTEGNTLEVGVGTGKNLEYYSDDVDLIGIDFSKKMLQKAQANTHKDRQNIDLVKMDVQDLDFSDDYFDSVVTSFVFCSVPNPIKGLEEIRRVLKPNGKLVMLEHVRSSNKVLGWLMDVFNFIPLHIWGANCNRDTVENLRKAGFTNIKVSKLWMDIFIMIEVVQ